MGIYGFILNAVLVYGKYSEMVAARGLLFYRVQGSLGLLQLSL